VSEKDGVVPFLKLQGDMRSPFVLPLTAAVIAVGCITACSPASLQRTSLSADGGYSLPFPAGDSARLVQGNNGPWGHSGAAAFAFDFVMPIGSPVTAARPGRVFATESRFVDGNKTPGQENFVFIRHDDGTFARYYHLTQNGVLVTVGSAVARGDTIARSGNTGASAGPHLHFDVTRGCAEWGCQTIPVRFINAGADSLIEDRTYTAR
jgi:murein DD-endopeptidase MepM/ murein hydrolase activator NlpD